MSHHVQDIMSRNCASMLLITLLIASVNASLSLEELSLEMQQIKQNNDEQIQQLKQNDVSLH